LERAWRESGDTAAGVAWVTARVRAGELSPARVDVAALCGDPVALAARSEWTEGQRELLTRKALADRLEVTPATVKAWIDKGDFPVWQDEAGLERYDPVEVVRWRLDEAPRSLRANRDAPVCKLVWALARRCPDVTLLVVRACKRRIDERVPDDFEARFERQAAGRPERELFARVDDALDRLVMRRARAAAPQRLKGTQLLVEASRDLAAAIAAEVVPWALGAADSACAE
jgi:hypothetical protein